jgi:hypothetical protein
MSSHVEPSLSCALCTNVSTRRRWPARPAMDQPRQNPMNRYRGRCAMYIRMFAKANLSGRKDMMAHAMHDGVLAYILRINAKDLTIKCILDAGWRCALCCRSVGLRFGSERRPGLSQTTRACFALLGKRWACIVYDVAPWSRSIHSACEFCRSFCMSDGSPVCGTTSSFPQGRKITSWTWAVWGLAEICLSVRTLSLPA